MHKNNPATLQVRTMCGILLKANLTTSHFSEEMSSYGSSIIHNTQEHLIHTTALLTFWTTNCPILFKIWLAFFCFQNFKHYTILREKQWEEMERLSIDCQF